jgi:plastocyanin
MAGREGRVRGRLLGGLLMAGVMMVGAAACQRDSAPAGATGPLSTPDGPGAISGRIEFVGTPPPRPELRVSSDPNCVMNGDTILSEAVVVGREGGLQNVFVYVSDGLGDRRYEVPSEPVVLDQVGCRYIPHVFGVQVGQPVQIINSDPTLHNVHATTRGANFFNFTQMAGQGASMRDFKEPEVMVPLRCDVHGWMIAYAGVLTHPYYAVTDEDGRFAIRGLPPGTYTVEAWHERLGVQTATVTITEDEPEDAIDFSFEMQG